MTANCKCTIDRNQRGYALLVAVAAIAVFAALAMAIETATMINTAGAAGALSRARAEAAADSGLAIAEHGLIVGEDQILVLRNGRQHKIELDGSQVNIRIIDERGKIPLGNIEEAVVKRMFEQIGLSGQELSIASDSFQDWVDGDDERRPNGAEAAWYAPLGYAPRNGPPISVDELARIRGVGPRVALRLRSYVTADPDVHVFDPKYAQRQALAAMSEGGDLAPDSIEHQREDEGQQVALDIAKKADLLNRPMTIEVDADAPGGGHAHHEVVIVLTGNEFQPYTIHAVR